MSCQRRAMNGGKDYTYVSSEVQEIRQITAVTPGNEISFHSNEINEPYRLCQIIFEKSLLSKFCNNYKFSTI